MPGITIFQVCSQREHHLVNSLSFLGTLCYQFASVATINTSTSNNENSVPKMLSDQSLLAKLATSTPETNSQQAMTIATHEVEQIIHTMPCDDDLTQHFGKGKVRLQQSAKVDIPKQKKLALGIR